MSITIVIVVLVVLAIIIRLSTFSLVPFMDGVWLTPSIYANATNKYVYLYIKGNVGYIAIQDGDKTLANNIVKLHYPFMDTYRFNLNSFRMPIMMDPPIDWSGAGTKQESVSVHVSISSGKLILFDNEDNIITVLQKDPTYLGGGPESPSKTAEPAEAADDATPI